MAITNKVLKAHVDRLGKLNNEIKVMEKEQTEIKAFLKATGKTEIFGDIFRAVISFSSRVSLDQELIKQSMGAKFEAWKAKHSKATPVTTIKVY